MGRSHQITSDGHWIAIGWTFYRMGSVPNFFNGWNLFYKDSINKHRFESFYAHFILFLSYCVIYFSLLTWHFQSCLNPISILSASDVCECCIVLYRNPFCPMAIRCLSDVKYFWCEGAIIEWMYCGFTGGKQQYNTWSTFVHYIKWGQDKKFVYQWCLNKSDCLPSLTNII